MYHTHNSRAFNIGPFKDGKPAQLFPPALEEHAAEIERFQKYCMDLVLKLLTLFSIGLEVCKIQCGLWFSSCQR